MKIPYYICQACYNESPPLAYTNLHNLTCDEFDFRNEIMKKIVEIFVDKFGDLSDECLETLYERYYDEWRLDQDPIECYYYDFEENKWNKFIFTEQEFFEIYYDYFHITN